MAYEDIDLEDEQQRLLSSLVEAARSVPRDKRRKFILLETSNGAFIKHFGLAPNHALPAYKGDVEILGMNGLLLLSYNSSGSILFDVAPLGFKYYEEMKLQSGEPVQRIDNEIREYLSSQHFQDRFAAALSKWRSAEESLWSSESSKQLTLIGHLCRESIQEFATALVEQYNPSDVDPDKAHHIARLRAVIVGRTSSLGKTLPPLLDAVITYWGTLSDLVQRLEHAGLKEGEPVDWDDARRVVFHTAILMFEIDRALSRTS